MRRRVGSIVVAVLLGSIAPACGRIGFHELGSEGSPGSVQDRDAAGSAGSSTDSGPRDGGRRKTGSGGQSGGNRDGGAAGGNGAGGTGASGESTGGSAPDGAAPSDGGAVLVSIALAPLSAAMLTGGAQRFTADVSGSADVSVTWSVAEGSSGGVVGSTGSYVASATPGTYHVVATSNADPSKRARAVVTVSAKASATVGGWTDATSSGINLDPAYDAAGNYGVLDVVVDPARPSDLYAFVCYQGVWRSTDYGQSWAKVSTGANGTVLETGRPWTAAIDPDPLRDPGTPPTLYLALGWTAAYGVWKSTDGGVSWASHLLPASTGQGVCALDVDPYDGTHLIVGLSQGPNFAESTDGAASFKAITGLPAASTAFYPFFVDTGHATTTRTTWLAISEAGATGGIFRTADGGSSWKQSSAMGHSTGSSQIFEAGSGVIYAGGSESSGSGLFSSSDYGASFALASAGGANGVIATPSYLYRWTDGAALTPLPPLLMRAPRGTAAPWTAVATPPGMTNGPKRAAVTYDGAHYVIVGGNWTAGIWRYVEP